MLATLYLASVPPVPSAAPPAKMSAPVSPPGGREPPVKNSPYSAKQQQQSTLIYSSDMGGRGNMQFLAGLYLLLESLALRAEFVIVSF